VTEDPEKLEAILRRVRGLMAVADHPNTNPEEAEAFRTKAEALMLEYRIAELQLGTPDQQAGIVPKWRQFKVPHTKPEFSSTYNYIWAQCLGHVDARWTSLGLTYDPETRDMWYVLDACGYDADLRYADLLATAFMLGFASKMDPKVDPNKSDAENAYVLRSAGWEGWRIAKALWGVNDKAHRSRARRLFAQHARSIGEDPAPLLGQSNRVTDFRDSYTLGFQQEAAMRLWRMRQSRGSGELVLVDRKNKVLEEFYGKYPNLRPGNPGKLSLGTSQKECPKCKKAKSGYCRDHQYLKPSTKKYREHGYSPVGEERGRAAAQSVDLNAQERRLHP
jgi:hypothetical protein